MNRCLSLGLALVTLAALALCACARADAGSPPGTGPLARVFRGTKDVLISPLEIPATIRRVAAEYDPFYGLWAGSLEGVGNGLMRLSAGVVELISFPIPGETLPLYNKRLGERATPPVRPPTGVASP
jgi:putative exosortase-associated protein (TIGR04073 family)